MNKFVVRMLELGAELDKAVSPIEISMVINDAEILYKNHIEQLTLTDVGCSFCEEIPKSSFYLGQTCEQCNKPFRVVKNKQ